MALTLGQALHHGIKTLLDVTDVPQVDASALLRFVTCRSELELITCHTEPLTPAQEAAFLQALERRKSHEPVAYITGQREFWGLNFAVRPGVLIPRPDTETLIGTLLALLPERDIALKVADLGVGSGAIVLSLLTEYPNFVAYGVDVEDTPLAVTAENAQKFGVASRLQLLKGSWADVLPEAVNIIVSNPPYIAPEVYSALDPMVKNYEPETALKAEHNGLAAYQALIPSAYSKLVEGGMLMLEIGYDQRHSVGALFDETLWHAPMTFKDLAGRDRVIVAIKKEQ